MLLLLLTIMLTMTSLVLFSADGVPSEKRLHRRANDRLPTSV